jgi:hypothetical protein
VRGGYRSLLQVIDAIEGKKPLFDCQEVHGRCALFNAIGVRHGLARDRQVRVTREEGNALKRQINTQWIYPPAPTREAAFATANPDHFVVARGSGRPYPKYSCPPQKNAAARYRNTRSRSKK